MALPKNQQSPASGWPSNTPFILAVDAGCRPSCLGIYPFYQTHEKVRDFWHKHEHLDWTNQLLKLAAQGQERHLALESLGQVCAELLDAHQTHWGKCLAILWGEGPGSFTGLRISATFFQTIAACFKLAHFPIDSLMATAQAYVVHQAKAATVHWSEEPTEFLIVKQLTAKMATFGVYCYEKGINNWYCQQASTPIACEALSQFLESTSQNVQIIFDGDNDVLFSALQAKNRSHYRVLSASNYKCDYLTAFLFLKARELCRLPIVEIPWSLNFEPNYGAINPNWA